jgi:hypothetical protein
VEITLKVDDETLVPTTSGPVMVMVPGPQAGQAHVVRVQQVHDGTTLVGGYTTVLLPT